MSSIQYLGHSCFKVQLDNIVCLFDPVVSNTISASPRKIPSALDPMAIRECDLIFITHELPDHCEPDTIKTIAERTFASVVAPKPALAKIDISDRFKIDVRTQDKFTVKGLDIEVIKAVHPQSAYPVGYLVKNQKYKIYHAGSTYSFREMVGVGADIAILPIGGTYTMDPFAAANVCKEMRPKYTIPMQYNTTERISQDVSEFSENLGTITKPLVLQVGQSAKLP